MSVEVTATGSPTSVSVSSNTISASVSTGQGPAGTVTIGTVTTGAPGSSAAVVNVGTPTNAVLNFTIPAGADGEGGGGSVAWVDITGKPSTFTPATHTHSISDVTSLQTTLDGKASSSHSHAISDVTGLQTALDGKQASGSYAAASHSHAISDVTGLQTELDGKQASGSYAAASHSHAIGDVTGLQTALDGKQASGSYAAATHSHAISDVTGLQTALDGKASSSHTHSGSDITSGTLGIARIPTGTSSSTVCIGNDARLSDARTPSAHAASHGVGGSDALSLLATQVETGTDTAYFNADESVQTALTELSTAVSGKAATSHSHSGSDITSGTVGTARLGSGTANSTTFLRGDGTWATPSGGGSGSSSYSSVLLFG